MTRHPIPLLLLLLLLLLALNPLLLFANPDMPPWEVRYGQHHDQTEAWTEAGYLPDFRFEWRNRQAPDVSWHDRDSGDCRGWILLGTPRRLPTPAPAALTLDLEFQTHCDLDPPRLRRSGHLIAFLMTPECWSRLAAAPADARILNLAQPGMLTVTLHGQGDDVHEWTEAGTARFEYPGKLLQTTDVVVGGAWGASHFHCREWGGIRAARIHTVSPDEQPWEFWRALDLQRPELAAVQQAVDRKDEPAATAALAHHIRTRDGPVPAQALAPADPGTKRLADEIRQGTHRLLGCPPYTFPDTIVWNADPFNYEQWAIALNRHYHWPVLARAHLASETPVYAQTWAQQLRHWVEHMPVIIGGRFIQGPYNTPGKMPLSLDAGIRMGQSWFPTLQAFRASPAVPDDVLVLAWKSFLQHAHYLLRDENYKHGSNWGAMEANGLFHLGVLLPEFRDAQRWRTIALERLCTELTYQVYPDGAQTELTPGYHGVTLHNFLHALDLARANRIEMPPHFVAGLEAMFAYYTTIMMPDRRTPALNDSGRGSVLRTMRRGADLFPERKDFLWIATDGMQGVPPPFRSAAMPYAGWVVFRENWTREAKYLLFDAGPFGTGHQHEDKLGIILHAYGHEFLPDAGTYAYDKSPWRRYVLSTRGHNTIRIDGKDQACRSDRTEWRAQTADTHEFRQLERFEYAEDRHTAGYGAPPEKTVTHRRRILFVRPDYWIVLDDLRAEDETVHHAEVQFLLNVPDARIEPDGRVITAPAGPQNARLAIVPLGDPVEPQLLRGRTQPDVQGFLPEGFERLRPIPAALFRTTFRRQASLAFALVPYLETECPLGPATTTGETPERSVTFSWNNQTHRWSWTEDRLEGALQLKEELSDAVSIPARPMP